MKIIGISGSLRSDSYNTKVLKYAGSFIENFEIINIEAPLYNEDLEITKDLVDIQKKISESDAILITTPEYNHSISGALKNFIDWMSIEPLYPFDGKKVGIMSASTGTLGGVRAQLHLRQILTGMGAKVVSESEVFIGNVQTKIENNQIIDEKTKKHIKNMVDLLIDSHH